MAQAKKGGRRPAKKTKAETTEVNSGAQLLLSNLPSDKDATYQYETLLGLMAKSRSAAGRVGDHKKKMREAGFDVDAFLRMMKLERMDPIDLAAHMKETQRLLRLRGMPVQMDLYEPRYDSAEDQAYAEGLALGKAGKSPDTERWAEGGAGHDEHLRGWKDGQAELVKLGGKPKKDGKPKAKPEAESDED